MGTKEPTETLIVAPRLCRRARYRHRAARSMIACTSSSCSVGSPSMK